MKYKMTYPQFLIFHEFIVDLNFFNFIIMPKSGVGVKSNIGTRKKDSPFFLYCCPLYNPYLNLYLIAQIIQILFRAVLIDLVNLWCIHRQVLVTV